jgi:hypothetical protein
VLSLARSSCFSLPSVSLSLSLEEGTFKVLVLKNERCKAERFLEEERHTTDLEEKNIEREMCV